MGQVVRLKAWAERARRKDYAEAAPLSRAEALGLAAELAEALASTEADSRLLLLATLHEIHAALGGRERRLEAEMADASAELRRLDRTQAARRAYQSWRPPVTPARN
jgi:hypothetical protein